ncbi:MAG: UDP-3-O-(3-hydroxymyristoyl)glucosamine N-acyltransferase, partial [Candidatus Margulisbacteria bacterium]|nr:UDP-3-O-(3-hydroxymyristoyl)glucosamine N-acyltransferase [Candidatus Margulisiibacteriota bacterium]
VTFGKHVQVGGMAGFNGHINVGDNTIVMAKAGVTKDIPANSVVSGFPAEDHREQLKQQAALKKLLKKTG